MSEKETNHPNYLNHPYERFLQLRVEFLILTQNELEAKIMRIIEMCVENKRNELYLKAATHTPKGKKVDIPDDLWVPIPHRVFLDWLHGTVQSETTLKDAINNLCNKYLIFKRPGKERYDAMFFMLNKPLINHLYTLFPKDVRDVNMINVMKQPRKSKEVEGQKLAPSEIDPLIQRIREAITDPLNSQLLTPLGANIDPLTERGGSQKLPPKKKYKKIQKESKKESPSPAVDDTPTHVPAIFEKEKGTEPLPPAEPEDTPFVAQLVEQHKPVARLWQQVDQNIDQDLHLYDGAINHLGYLSSRVHTMEEMNSLVVFTRKQLSEEHKKEIWRVQLGNLKHYCPDWLHAQQPARASQTHTFAGYTIAQEEPAPHFIRPSEKNRSFPGENLSAQLRAMQVKYASTGNGVPGEKLLIAGSNLPLNRRVKTNDDLRHIDPWGQPIVPEPSPEEHAQLSEQERFNKKMEQRFGSIDTPASKEV